MISPRQRRFDGSRGIHPTGFEASSHGILGRTLFPASHTRRDDGYIHKAETGKMISPRQGRHDGSRGIHPTDQAATDSFVTYVTM